MKYTALFCRTDSAYKKRAAWDVYDIDRDATEYHGNLPVVCHPPCRAWGRLSHMASPREGEKELAIWSLDEVNRVGGIVEHPSGSKLWEIYRHIVPDSEVCYIDGSFVIEIDQYDFGHVAHKKTKLVHQVGLVVMNYLTYHLKTKRFMPVKREREEASVVM